jgi:hypothetical protein
MGRYKGHSRAEMSFQASEETLVRMLDTMLKLITAFYIKPTETSRCFELNFKLRM